MIFSSNNESNEHHFLYFIHRITSGCFLHECLNNCTSLTIRSCIHAGCRSHRFAFLFFQCKKMFSAHFFYCLKLFFFSSSKSYGMINRQIMTNVFQWYFLFVQMKRAKKNKKQRTIFCFVDVFGPRYLYFCLYILNVNKI